jgi:hypothetical protein
MAADKPIPDEKPMTKFRVHVSVCGMIYYEGSSIEDVVSQIETAQTIKLDDLDYWDCEVLKIEDDAVERQWETENGHPHPVTEKIGVLNKVRRHLLDGRGEEIEKARTGIEQSRKEIEEARKRATDA